MELKLENGRYVPGEQGALAHVSGTEELRQRILMKLAARRGGFPLLPGYGSRLHLLGRVRPSERQSVAAQYVMEALADESRLELTSLELTDLGGGTARLSLVFEADGEAVRVETNI